MTDHTRENLDFVVVRPREGRNSASFQAINEKTLGVHIADHPFLWAIRLILERGPNVQAIQVIPSLLVRLESGESGRLCAERGIQLIGGHVRPGRQWKRKGEQSNAARYISKQQSMLALSQEQRALLDELLAIGAEEAEMAVRYFRLENGKPETIFTLAAEYGYDVGGAHNISQKCNAVLLYLGVLSSAGKRAQQRAEWLRKRVARHRARKEKESAEKERLRELCDQLHIPWIPERFPLRRLELLGKLFAASRDGRLEQLRRAHPVWYRVLAARFGLEDGIYKERAMVGKIMGGKSNGRMRRLEKEALKFLEDTKE